MKAQKITCMYTIHVKHSTNKMNLRNSYVCIILDRRMICHTLGSLGAMLGSCFVCILLHSEMDKLYLNKGYRPDPFTYMVQIVD